MTDNMLSGHRILIVEDNALLAMSFEDIISRSGAEVVGPAGTLAEAEMLAMGETLSGAMLDIKLHYEEVWPVARILAGRGIPFVFCSGHFEPHSLPPEWAQRPILVKPARPRHIIEKLLQAVGLKV
ncbi:MAG: response regulator [Hyphomicrobiaceae bacterium]